MSLNAFRVLGDMSHILSKAILIWVVHRKRDAQGISLISQVLYALVFCARYLDLFWKPVVWGLLLYNFIGKIVYIASSLYILFLMLRVYNRSRELPDAWRIGTFCLGFAVVACIPVIYVFEGWYAFSISEVLWAFSIVLESVCILPQLLLLCETAVPTVIDSYYLLALGSYRALYILNWIYRGTTEHLFDPIAVIFGVIQTLIYIDFALVYIRRQRVILAPTGIVDRGDLSKSWFINPLFLSAMKSPLQTVTLHGAASDDIEGAPGPAEFEGNGNVRQRNDFEAQEQVDFTDPGAFDNDAEVSAKPDESQKLAAA